MITGIDINQRIEFSASNDVTEPKTVFILRPLSASEMMGYSADASKKEVERIFSLIEACVVEVKNFEPAGQSVKEIIKSLPVEVINELSLEIAKINHLGAIERKNS